jgi:hypothetical protein
VLAMHYMDFIMHAHRSMLQFPIEAAHWRSRIHTAPDRVPEEWFRELFYSEAGEFISEMIIAECAPCGKICQLVVWSRANQICSKCASFTH